MAQKLLIAAPASGTGKTSVTLGLLRAFSRQGLRVAAAKVGPDYIDTAFHSAACGRPSLTLDPWAMSKERLHHQLATLEADADLVIVESAMGLFDGAADGSATTAWLAKELGLPVALVIDCKGMAGSVAALAQGFARFDPHLSLAGCILNRVASPRHAELLADALWPLDLPVLAQLHRQDDLHLPSRHLGLVQAGDTQDLTNKLETLADWAESGLDIAAWELALQKGGLAQPQHQHQHSPSSAMPSGSMQAIPPLGRHIAIARDAAFSFIYPHLLADWQSQGAKLSFISPLAQDPLPQGCDALYLPGGYPELYAKQLSQAHGFWSSLHQAVSQGGLEAGGSDDGFAVYGECGGYMALGKTLIDAQSLEWPMGNLLDHSTRFDVPERHLGYRHMRSAAQTPLGKAGTVYRGHEFHYSVELTHGSAPENRQALWTATDAKQADLGSFGQVKGRVFGSYLHLVDSRTVKTA